MRDRAANVLVSDGALSERGSGPLGRGLSERSLYERDVYGWAVEQAGLIRAGRLDAVDLENVAEEIESVGRSERKALRSALARTIQHMLKWDFQSDRRSPSWERSVAVHRLHARQELRDNPSLKSDMPTILEDAFDLALVRAMSETALPREAFPPVMPYSLEEVLNRPL